MSMIEKIDNGIYHCKKCGCEKCKVRIETYEETKKWKEEEDALTRQA